MTLDEVGVRFGWSTTLWTALPEVVDAAAADPDTHSHSSAVSSVCIKAKGIAVDVDLFTRWIGGLLWEPEPPLEVYRSKGVISAAGSDAKHILQAVHELFDCQPSSEAWAEPVSDRETKVVFIGKGLDKDALQAGLLACCPSSSEAVPPES